MRVAEIRSLLAETGREWIEDDAPRLAAALAYYTLLSLAPLIVVAIALAGLVFGEEAARGQLSAQLSSIVGPHGGEAVEAIVNNADSPSGGAMATVLGLLVLFLGASGVFSELQSAMNKIWGAAPRTREGIWRTIQDRLFSFAMVMAVAFLLLVSLILSALLAAVGRFFESSLPGGEALWQVINLGISFGIVTLLFALILKYVPDVEIGWRDVWIGAIATALLFDVGKHLIGFYLGKSSVSSAYGAAGSVVLMVIWVYYSTIILFLGAEFTQVRTRRLASRFGARTS